MILKEIFISLYEDIEKIKKYKWRILLVFLVITSIQEFVKRIIEINTYNIILACTIILIGIYLIYGFIGYIKKSEKYDMKKDKLNIIISSVIILLISVYLASLLII